MVALFSSLQSSGNAETTLSSSIPTLIQLYKTKAIQLEPNVTPPGHAVLSYQAIEVSPTAEDATLFGQKINKAAAIVNPNLGVWNCLVTVESGSKEPSLVDKLLCIPDSTAHYCFTVDLTEPSKVEPVISSLQEALVRLMIEHPPKSLDKELFTTSLMQLRKTTFGLAPNDDEAAGKLSTAAPAESDEKINFALMIVAIVPTAGNNTTSTEAYKTTQAQSLLLYHLRKYAAALNGSLCFVQDSATSDGAEQNQATMSIEQLANVWKEWAQSIDILDSPAMYTPGKHQIDLIESVLLRNAHCPGHWEASKDSIWKALPPVKDAGKNEFIKNEASGDDLWLCTLRDSVAADTTSVPSSTSKANQATPKAKEDAAAASSFFENLLNS